MILLWKDGRDGGEGGTLVGGWETVRWVFVFCEKMKKKTSIGDPCWPAKRLRVWDDICVVG